VIDLGANIRRLRTAAGLTQTEAAEAAGVRQPAWSDFERGKRVPGVFILHRMAESLGATVDDLLSESPSGGN